MSINLTPFIPISFKGEGEDIKKKGEAPLKHLISLIFLKREGSIT
ncbi:hypothetical protein ES703_66149 [subsurface metagenome]